MNKENFKKKGVHWGILFGVLAVTLMLSTQMIPTPKLEHEPTWHILWEGTLAEAAEANPGAGVSGFLGIYFLNHTATPTTAYDSNTSSDFETWADANLKASGGTHAYASADNFHLEVKHSTTFDVVCRARFNRTVAYNGTMFRDADCRINITASGGGVTISGATAGANDVSKNTSTNDYIWINVYWTNGGAGYSLNKGGTCTISQISIQAKY